MKSVPFYNAAVSAGFPSPAAPYAEDSLDLEALLIKHRAATFFMRALGVSMEPMIHNGDILVVDRALTPKPGDICVVALYGELCCKSVYANCSPLELRSLNPEYETILVNQDTLDSGEFELWGVVSAIVRELR